MWGFFQHCQIAALKRAWRLPGAKRRLLWAYKPDAPIGPVRVLPAAHLVIKRAFLDAIAFLRKLGVEAMRHMRLDAVAYDLQRRILGERLIEHAPIHFLADALSPRRARQFG